MSKYCSFFLQKEQKPSFGEQKPRNLALAISFVPQEVKGCFWLFLKSPEPSFENRQNTLCSNGFGGVLKEQKSKSQVFSY